MSLSDDCEVKNRESESTPLEKDKPKEIPLKRLERAWKCITTPEFLQRSQVFAVENGEGLGVYKFLIPSSADKLANQKPKGNCVYYYADKGCPLWDAIVNRAPNKISFENAYQSSSMYAVCVCVPIDTNPDETVQSVRLFHYDTHKEVVF